MPPPRLCREVAGSRLPKAKLRAWRTRSPQRGTLCCSLTPTLADHTIRPIMMKLASQVPATLIHHRPSFEVAQIAFRLAHLLLCGLFADPDIRMITFRLASQVPATLIHRSESSSEVMAPIAFNLAHLLLCGGGWSCSRCLCPLASCRSWARCRRPEIAQASKTGNWLRRTNTLRTCPHLAPLG